MIVLFIRWVKEWHRGEKSCLSLCSEIPVQSVIFIKFQPTVWWSWAVKLKFKIAQQQLKKPALHRAGLFELKISLKLITLQYHFTQMIYFIVI